MVYGGRCHLVVESVSQYEAFVLTHEKKNFFWCLSLRCPSFSLSRPAMYFIRRYRSQNDVNSSIVTNGISYLAVKFVRLMVSAFISCPKNIFSKGRLCSALHFLIRANFVTTLLTRHDPKNCMDITTQWRPRLTLMSLFIILT